MSIIGNVNNTVNSSVLNSSLSSSPSSASAQSALLTSVYTKEVPNISFTKNGQSQPLSDILNTALSNNTDFKALKALNTQSSVNSYAATDALLEAAYGNSSINQFV